MHSTEKELYDAFNVGSPEDRRERRCSSARWYVAAARLSTLVVSESGAMMSSIDSTVGRLCRSAAPRSE